MLQYPEYAAGPRESMTIPKAACCLLARCWTVVYVDVLPTHEPNEAELADPSLYAEVVQVI